MFLAIILIMHEMYMKCPHPQDLLSRQPVTLYRWCFIEYIEFHLSFVLNHSNVIFLVNLCLPCILITMKRKALSSIILTVFESGLGHSV